MRGERGMSDVVETTSDEDGGAQGLEGRIEGRKEGNAKRSGRAQGADGGAQGLKGRIEGREGCKGAIILLFHRGRTPRWR